MPKSSDDKGSSKMDAGKSQAKTPTGILKKSKEEEEKVNRDTKAENNNKSLRRS
jgi:hypothetical protein